VAQMASVGLIVVGLAGALVAKPSPELGLLSRRAAGVSPIVVTERPANLPWFQNNAPHFVFATTYLQDRAQGRQFAFGGIAGMIRSGKIKILVCPRNKIGETFDGISPASLRKVGEDSYWAYMATDSLR
jgi:hypothetical protein